MQELGAHSLDESIRGQEPLIQKLKLRAEHNSDITQNLWETAETLIVCTE